MLFLPYQVAQAFQVNRVNLALMLLGLAVVLLAAAWTTKINELDHQDNIPPWVRKLLRGCFVLFAVACVLVMDFGSGQLAIVTLAVASLMMAVGSLAGAIAMFVQKHWIQGLMWVVALAGSVAMLAFAGWLLVPASSAGLKAGFQGFGLRMESVTAVLAVLAGLVIIGEALVQRVVKEFVRPRFPSYRPSRETRQRVADVRADLDSTRNNLADTGEQRLPEWPAAPAARATVARPTVYSPGPTVTDSYRLAADSTVVDADEDGGYVDDGYAVRRGAELDEPAAVTPTKPGNDN